MNNKMTNLMSQLSTIQIPTLTVTTRTRSDVKSFSIIRSKESGKRVSISKTLIDTLGLDDIAYVIPFVSEGVLALTREKLNPDAVKLNLKREGKGKEKKLGYNAMLVEYLINAYGLDYSTCVSRTFTEIDIEDANGVPVAFIRLTQPTASAAASAGQEEDA
jgi:hypothetical protein